MTATGTTIAILIVAGSVKSPSGSVLACEMPILMPGASRWSSTVSLFKPGLAGTSKQWALRANTAVVARLR